MDLLKIMRAIGGFLLTALNLIVILILIFVKELNFSNEIIGIIIGLIAALQTLLVVLIEQIFHIANGNTKE